MANILCLIPDAADADRLVMESRGTDHICDDRCLFESSPLKPDELQVLRAQYEKEGEYVGVQTKFNYAWVRVLQHDYYAGIL